MFPRGEKRFAVPLLLVYALIDRPFILDLIPGNSFVEYLVEQGFEVYLLDWGVPGEEDHTLAFDHYVLDYLPRAVKQVLKTSHSEAISLFGACIGGLISAMYAAPFPGPALRNLILYVTPIDFSPQYLGYFRWAKFLHPEEFVEAFGNVPPAFVGSPPRLFKLLTDHVGSCLRSGLRQGERLPQDQLMATLIAINRWVSEGIPFPGEAFRQLACDVGAPSTSNTSHARCSVSRAPRTTSASYLRLRPSCT